jgi:hypothetical protein
MRFPAGTNEQRGACWRPLSTTFRIISGSAPVEQVLDLAGKDILAAGDDHLVIAAFDEQATGLIDAAGVTSGHQATEPVFAPTAGIAVEEHLVAGEDSTDLAVRNVLGSF